MTDELALLTAVLAAPDDDTPRLAYADWLDDHGHADRAEFIRAQCRLARGAAEFGDDERALELEERNRGRWLVGLPHSESVAWFFRRGFPELLQAPIGKILERYDRYAAVPWVRGLNVYDLASSSVRDFVSRSWNPGWVELNLMAEPPGTADSAPIIAAVADCQQARQLRILRFSLFDVTTTDVDEVLAASPYLDGLNTLEIEEEHPPPFDRLRERFGDRFRVIP